MHCVLLSSCMCLCSSIVHESFLLYFDMCYFRPLFRVSVPCRPDLMVKKLRYYARFIVVCLLLKKMKLVRDLVRVSVAQCVHMFLFASSLLRWLIFMNFKMLGFLIKFFRFLHEGHFLNHVDSWVEGGDG